MARNPLIKSIRSIDFVPATINAKLFIAQDILAGRKVHLDYRPPGPCREWTRKEIEEYERSLESESPDES